MSGVCSKHHDPVCDLCKAMPLEGLEAIQRNGWAIVEIIVAEAYLDLEQAVRDNNIERAEKIVVIIDELRKLKRNLKTWSEQ